MTTSNNASILRGSKPMGLRNQLALCQRSTFAPKTNWSYQRLNQEPTFNRLVITFIPSQTAIDASQQDLHQRTVSDSSQASTSGGLKELIGFHPTFVPKKIQYVQKQLVIPNWNEPHQYRSLNRPRRKRVCAGTNTTGHPIVHLDPSAFHRIDHCINRNSNNDIG